MEQKIANERFLALSRICLNNWHYITKRTLSFNDESHFFPGHSGSGKSTLLHMMGGLDTPTSGSVIVRGDELAKKNDEELTIFRRRNIGFIFQNYNLVPILNVYENIVLPVELDGDTVDQNFMDGVVHLSLIHI